MQSCGRLWGYFGAFPSQFWRVSASIHNCGLNMDTPLHSRDQGTVKTGGFWRRTGSEEGEDGEIGRQSDGHGFLGCTRNHLHRLLGKRNDNCTICDVIAPVERRNKEKRPHLKKKNILFHQDNARVHTCAISMAKIMELKFELLHHPQYSPDLASSDFFFISKLAKMARRTKVHVERGGHRPNRCLFWKPFEILLFGRLKKVGETLGEVYRVKKRLCWEIKKNHKKYFVFPSSSKDLLNDPRSFISVQFLNLVKV